jgi:LCP family protein required for cell wall assembly
MVDTELWYDVPHTKKKLNKKNGFPWIPTIIMMLVVFALFAYGGYRFAEWYITRNLFSYQPGEEETQLGDELAGEKRINILLLGVDQRGKEAARSDTIMVAFLDLKKPDVKILSIPRDTRVEIPGHGKQKLNHSHAYGGAELTMEVVSNLLDVPIEKYVEVNFKGFEDVIDALGGVEMEVEKKMQYKAEGIDLKPGLQRLDGKDALGYVRYRSDGDDTTRIARQQKFMKELIEEVLQLSTIWKLPKLVTEVNQCVTTNLSYSEMLGLANAMRKLDSSTLEGQMLPGRPQYIRNISYWIPDFDAVEELMDLYTGKTKPTEDAEE